MHHPVNKNANPEAKLAAAMARHLLSPSERFENASERAHEASNDGMRCMATLDKATKLSLPILPSPGAAMHATTAPTEAPTNTMNTTTAAAAQPPAPRAPAPKAPAGPRFDSKRTEYKPALGNPGVVEALLGLHHNARQGKAPGAPLAGSNGFYAAPAPRVEARPKPEPAAKRGVTRIFRPRGDF